MSQPFHIAVDGPVSAGKGTICRLVADKLDVLYVDTGATYRVAALIAHRQNVDFKDEQKVADLVATADIHMRVPSEEEKDGRLVTVLVDGEDVSWKIRTEEVGRGSSVVAALPSVRKILVATQQKIAEGQNVIMEGRDITYRVLPDADMKIFLTASDVVRAKRRHLQLQARGADVSFEEVYSDLIERDKNDSTRSTDPLKIVPSAWVIDTSDLSISDVVDIIIARVHSLKATPQTPPDLVV